MFIDKFEFIEKRLLDEFSKPLHKGISELASELGLKDNTTLLHHIRKLVNAGFLIKIKKGNYKTVLNSNAKNSNVLEIPFYGNARCGDGGEFLGDHPDYYIPMNIQLVKRNSKDLFALRSVGDSMQPSITEGDTVIAEKYKNESPDKNGFYVVCNNQEVMIKKVLYSKQGGFLLSTNSEHLPIPINSENFKIAGKVVGVYKSF